MKKIWSIFVFLVLSFLLVSCSIVHDSKAEYFDGNAIVEYHQTFAAGEYDYLTMTFSEKGEYRVIFSFTKGKEDAYFNTGKMLPEGFSVLIDDNPKTKLVSQEVLPGFLTVTIKHNGVTESHEFE